MEKMLITPLKKLLELINKLSKVAEYKINMQKCVTFLCTYNKLAEIKKSELQLNPKEHKTGL